nr:E3 ubiquitin-protein ligase RKP-like [Quercus suber]
MNFLIISFQRSCNCCKSSLQVVEFQQRKCSVIFDLSCNLTRVLEFCTHEIPQAFLLGTDTNLRRLTELIVFILNHVTSAVDAEFFDLSLRRHGHSLEKVNRGMILAPLVGIILNLFDASSGAECREHNDVVGVFASMDCPKTVHCGFQYLLNYNWAGSFRGDAYLGKLGRLEKFASIIISRTESQVIDEMGYGGEIDGDDSTCCICYSGEADSQFVPCSHRSCHGCITRHLLNCQRCFFCNATVVEVVRISNEL